MSKMKKKAATLMLVFICAASLFLAFSPSAHSQTDSLNVVSYSWYTSVWTGDFIVVGEVQNVGQDILSNAVITGIAYTTDQQAQATSDFTSIYTRELLPGGTAPFYMEFTPSGSNWGNLTWVELGIDRIDFHFFSTKLNSTTPARYQDLRIMGATNYTDAAGNYTATGVIWNTGTGYPEKVWVAAAFYDASNKVVAVGMSNYVTPRFLPPNNSTQFTVIPYDPTPSMASKITSFNLTVLTEGSTTQPTTTPTPSPSSTSTPSTSSSPTSGPSTSADSSASPDSGDSGGLAMKYVYAIIAAVVIAVAVIVVAFIVRKGRKS
jgi:hypothetical protein